MNKLVSVVVPIYNSERYIAECIESIIKQTYKNIEIILINDGSKDNSIKVCEKYSKEDTRINIISKDNGGVSDARNVGIEKSRGDYIIFVDSDDILERDSIEKRVENYQKDNLIITGYDSNYPSDNSRRTVKHVYSSVEDISYICRSNIIELLELGSLNSPCDKIYDLKILKLNNIFFEKNISLGEDLIFNLEYIKYINKGFIFINRPLYHCMIRGNESLCKKYHENIFEVQIKKNQKIREIVESINILTSEKEKILYNRYFKDLIMANSSIFLHNKKASIIKRLKIIKINMQNQIFKDIIYNVYKYGEISNLEYLILENKMFLVYKILEKLKGDDSN